MPAVWHPPLVAVRLGVERHRPRPDSDIDLLVEFAPGAVPGFLGMSAIEAELSELMDGRQVDLRTPRELSRYFREEVMREAEVQFAA